MRYKAKLCVCAVLLFLYVTIAFISVAWIYKDGNQPSSMTSAVIPNGGDFFIARQRHDSGMFIRLSRNHLELSNTLNQKLCPREPDGLVGRLNVTIDYLVTNALSENAPHLRHLNYGGTYEPSDCLAREATAIIIPYRDRPDHLMMLLAHLHLILQRQKLKYGIFVVEMELPTQFNRGLLANVGFHNAASIANYSCYVIHDVDLIPRDDRNLYVCGSNPRHLMTASSKYKDELPYEEYVGGVLALTPSQFKTINGFSNLYFGWGGEDDDISQRIDDANFTVEKPEYEVGDYLALPHKGDNSNPRNPHRNQLLAGTVFRRRFEGLSSLQYNRRALEFRHTYTWVLAHVLESEVMKKYKRIQAEPPEQANKRHVLKIFRRNKRTDATV